MRQRATDPAESPDRRAPGRRAALVASGVALCCPAACGPAVEWTPPPVGPVAPASPSAAPAKPAPLPPAPALGDDTDEGMWTFDDFPADRTKKRHGFAPDREWLDHVRKSSVRLARGCSGSFVSPQGLVLTNHHCAQRCIQHLSSPKKDLMKTGFLAAAEKDEAKCPEIEVNVLSAISDVTDRVRAATKDRIGKDYNDARKAEFSRIEKECARSDDLRCDVVTLYQGGKYHLYEYRRWQDVRLVFAPEFSTAFFGGDPDNFMFPRWDLDVSFLRVYEGGKPARPDHWLRWSRAGVRAGDVTFVSGHPWSTARLKTIAELEYMRDVALPALIERTAEERGVLNEFAARGPEQARISANRRFGIENRLKAIRGRYQALVDRDAFAARVAAERDLRSRVAATPDLAGAFGGAWDAIAAAQKRLRAIRTAYVWVEDGAGFRSVLFDHAREILRAAEELPKPNADRLREYGDAQLPALKQQLFSTAPVYAEFEALTLGLSLGQLREELGPDHPLVRKVLGKQAPRDLAAALVKGTKLADPKVRKALFDGGKAAVDASKDPMIDLARLVDADARAVRKAYEDEVEAVVRRAGEQIAKARYAVYGASTYPDATATLRLSFGKVAGWDEAGQAIAPLTTIGGAFDRHTGKDPFALPETWLRARAKLDASVALNFCSTNDIIGGNSGSPVVDRAGELVGLVFDGNIHSLGGDFWYDGRSNRAVAVHSAGIVEALDKVYGARRVLDEIRPK